MKSSCIGVLLIGLAHRFSFVFGSVLIVLVACGGGESPAIDNNQHAEMAQILSIQGAGVKGPLAYARVEAFAVDLNSPTGIGMKLSEGNTGEQARIQELNLEVPLPEHVLVAFSAQPLTIDITTGVAPVVGKMQVIVTAESLMDGRAVYATLLTSLVSGMALTNADKGLPWGGNVDGIVDIEEFRRALRDGNDLVNSTLGMGVSLNYSSTPPVFDVTVNNKEIEAEAILYRYLNEALSSLIFEMSLVSGMPVDELIDELMADLADGEIDGVIGSFPSRYDAAALEQLLRSPAALMIANSDRQLSEIGQVMQEESGVTELFVNEHDLALLRLGTARVFTAVDIDGDGVSNAKDHFPRDSSEIQDSDGDGIGDKADLFPLNPKESYDFNQNGIGDGADLDDDSDGVPDLLDAFPFNDRESVDTDSDGIGDVADHDDDGDGVFDDVDAFPLDIERYLQELSCGIPDGSGESELTKEIIRAGDEWRYLDDGSNQGTVWRTKIYDDTAWPVGLAEFGYGDNDEETVVSFGADSLNKPITTYFRKKVIIENVSQFKSFSLKLLRDDGAVVYLNGEEIVRHNLPAGNIDSETLARPADHENLFFLEVIDSSVFAEGENLFAVEIHQLGKENIDVGFDLELVAHRYNEIVRGPYLQKGAETSMVVRWRTNQPSDSALCFGEDKDNLFKVARLSEIGLDHKIEITGLSSDTKYFYAVGSTKKLFQRPDTNRYFKTSPKSGSTDKSVNIWVVGDSGTANLGASEVYKSYQAVNKGQHTDVWLMLGDNAYASGKDAEYQLAVFNQYADLLQQTVLWPAYGNHDAVVANATAESGPYFDIFSLSNGLETTGIQSNKEAYYSFDYGSIHFISLDSEESDRSLSGPMLTWLDQDLSTTTAEWKIAYWHHPPYSKGRYDSNTVPRLAEMRTNALPILERYHTDLVLTGHSHAYERSKLIAGHYGDSSDYADKLHAVDALGGNPSKDGSYDKASQLLGTVYVVAGNGGILNPLGNLDHPTSYISLRELGSLLIRLEGTNMTVRLIGTNQNILDTFTIAK